MATFLTKQPVHTTRNQKVWWGTWEKDTSVWTIWSLHALNHYLQTCWVEMRNTDRLFRSACHTLMVVVFIYSYLSSSLPVCLLICLSISMFVCQSVYLCNCLAAYLSVWMSLCLYSIYILFIYYLSIVYLYLSNLSI